MKTPTWIALLLTVVTASCGGGGKMEWKGTLRGEFALVDHKAEISGTYPPPAPLDKGNGSATLESGLDNLLRLGKDTTIPGCMLSFFPGLAKRDNTEKATAREFRLKDQSPIKRDGPGGAEGCVGRINKDGPLVEIEIDHALVSLTDDGEFYVGIDYRAKGDYDKKRVLRIKGTRGWF